MTFEQFEENRTQYGTYPYSHAKNSNSYDDIQAMRKNESYANKRRRRAWAEKYHAVQVATVKRRLPGKNFATFQIGSDGQTSRPTVSA